MFFEWLSATAVSFTVAGNTGVAPFLSLFLVGAIEKANPDLLNMGDSQVDDLLSSWPSLVVLGILSILDFVGHCVPVVDEIVDSAETFIIPILSAVGSMSTFGLFQMVAEEAGAAGADESNRRLSAASGALVFFQVIITLVGIVLALSMHAFKMVVRLIGVGWLTNILTVIEASWIVVTITLSIYVRPVAIFVGALICTGAIFGFKRKFVDKQRLERKRIREEEERYAAEQAENYGSVYEAA